MATTTSRRALPRPHLPRTLTARLVAVAVLMVAVSASSTGARVEPLSETTWMA